MLKSQTHTKRQIYKQNQGYNIQHMCHTNTAVQGTDLVYKFERGKQKGRNKLHKKREEISQKFFKH